MYVFTVQPDMLQVTCSSITPCRIKNWSTVIIIIIIFILSYLKQLSCFGNTSVTNTSQFPWSLHSVSPTVHLECEAAAAGNESCGCRVVNGKQWDKMTNSSTALSAALLPASRMSSKAILTQCGNMMALTVLVQRLLNVTALYAACACVCCV